MRPELRALPTEIWYDVLALLRCRQIAQRILQLGDRAFGMLAMRWLHSKGRHTLPMLSVDMPPEQPFLWDKKQQQQQRNSGGDGVGSVALAGNDGHQPQETSNCFIWLDSEPLPLAQIQLPDNIVDFAGIRIRAIDHGFIRFLRRLQPLFNDVNLRVYDVYDANVTATFWQHFSPLINTVNSIFFCSVYDFRQVMQQAAPMLFGARWMEFDFPHFPWHLADDVEPMWEWLCAKPRIVGSGGSNVVPRQQQQQQRFGKILKICGSYDYWSGGSGLSNGGGWLWGDMIFGDTVRMLQQKFLAATEPASFCILVWKWLSNDDDEVEEHGMCVHNARTGETMRERIFKVVEGDEHQCLVISRQPSAEGAVMDQTQLEGLIAWDFHKQGRMISLMWHQDSLKL